MSNVNINELLERNAALAAENEKLRAQMSELLPWSLAGALHIERTCSDDIGAVVPVGRKIYPLTRSKATALRKSIEDNLFGQEAK